MSSLYISIHVYPEVVDNERKVDVVPGIHVSNNCSAEDDSSSDWRTLIEAQDDLQKITFQYSNIPLCVGGFMVTFCFHYSLKV